MGGKQQEFREAIAWLKARGWRVDEERGGYPLAFCPCGRHTRSVHRTPSNPRHFAQMRAWVERTERNECQGGRP